MLIDEVRRMKEKYQISLDSCPITCDAANLKLQGMDWYPGYLLL